ncbi:anti-sigma factor [Microbacterium sp. 22195]|uniref:anti-sigma factor n=1 Tax=Microbacterium sp. 22195 TaxID=3453891 RepID=UPI003F8536EA
MNEREFAELAAGHALHALSEADERRLLEARAAHPEWHEHIDEDEQIAATLADALPPVAPPPMLRDELLARIATTPQSGADDRADAGPVANHAPEPSDPAGEASEAGPAADTAHPIPRRWSRALFALAACLVLIVGGGIATAVVVSQLQRPASVVALDEIRSAPDAAQATVKLGSGATATAHWSADLGEAVLVASGLERPEAGKTYELWFVRGDKPVSAGVFAPEDGSATALLKGSMRAGDVIAVTVEQSGGSPSGAPTSEPIIVIPTA